MDLDALLAHYFGTDEPEALDDAARARGEERLRIDFGVEQEPSRKFALWVVMEGLGIAPLPAQAFEKAPALKAAAEKYLDAAWRLERE
ncbi:MULTISPECIES: hypothetical protein [Sphingomonas]|uniref:Uncharacterized protein n=1 Tax=Sphingomonas leidyi TaxID=68569 RepID=A0A7X5ZWQ1_9SPHN|nr:MULTISPECIES: hypothetical protein [Sphingomonas]MBN8811161.1 hypothetical protein [Sphingomonas sp.]NIJ66465.1 hypothetical protein [Sphingomonas leidyi]OJY54632.1 MAG: hypothetical protein BGP17_06330 [Sphingomonas sp. 67-41]